MKPILIVEHDPIFRKALRRQLMARYEVFETASPTQAIEICRTHPQIAVLIADADMALVSGMELALLLRAWIPNLHAILLSDLPRDLWSDRQIAELNSLPAEGTILLRRLFSLSALDAALSELAPEPMAVANGSTFGQ